MKELVIEAAVKNLGYVLNFVDDELELGNCEIKARMQIAIAVEEIFVNIAHYAYSPEMGGAVILLEVGDEVVIRFEDSGKPYNPLEKRDPDTSAPLDERNVGGLGIFMAKNIMDSVSYQYENNKNILTMKKTIRKSDSRKTS